MLELLRLGYYGALLDVVIIIIGVVGAWSRRHVHARAHAGNRSESCASDRFFLDNAIARRDLTWGSYRVEDTSVRSRAGAPCSNSFVRTRTPFRKCLLV